MKPARFPLIIGLWMLVGSCLAQDSMAPALPPETPINRGAGRGDQLLVKLHLADGKELLFILDTGATATMLDSSLEPELGKRLGTKKFRWAGGRKQIAGVYKAPSLYLVNTPLLGGAATILTADLREKSVSPERPIKGILGIDCLRHYCVQLDFETARMRFLPPDHPKTEALGEAFPLSFSKSTGHAVVRGSLIGIADLSSEIDTGCNFDGVLTPKLFQRWTNQWQTASSDATAKTVFPNGVFGEKSYTNLHLSGDGSVNLLGLAFLARNLVTLNFPKQMMYLKQRTDGPLPGANGFFGNFYPEILRKQ